MNSAAEEPDIIKLVPRSHDSSGYMDRSFPLFDRLRRIYGFSIAEVPWFLTKGKDFNAQTDDTFTGRFGGSDATDGASEPCVRLGQTEVERILVTLT